MYMKEVMHNNYTSNKMNENVIYKKQTNEIDKFADDLYVSRISYKEI